MEAPLRDAALRVGLAARMLPDVEPARLMEVLIQAKGLPLTVEKLAAVTVRELQEAGDGLFSATPLPAMKRALDYLWGREGVEVSDLALPAIEPCGEGEMPASIRVAIASNNGDLLDGHFGSCARFLVYQVNAAGFRLVDIRSMAGIEGKGDERNARRAEALADCHLLYVISIGGPAAAKVIKHEVHPIKVDTTRSAAELLGELQQVLAGSPPPWLAKVMGKSPQGRAHFAGDDEGEGGE